MIAVRSGTIRVAALVVAAVVLQVSAVAHVGILGAHADLVPLLVAAIAFYAGSVPGAVTGFSAGLLLDLAVGHDVGAASLVLTTVGYLVGRYREQRDPGHGLVPVPLAAMSMAGYTAGFAAVSFMLEVEASVSLLVFREMLVTALVNAALALPVFAVVRRVMRRALAVDPLERRPRRREARPAGPLGLRGLEV